MGCERVPRMRKEQTPGTGDLEAGRDPVWGAREGLQKGRGLHEARRGEKGLFWGGNQDTALWMERDSGRDSQPGTLDPRVHKPPGISK